MPKTASPDILTTELAPQLTPAFALPCNESDANDARSACLLLGRILWSSLGMSVPWGSTNNHLMGRPGNLDRDTKATLLQNPPFFQLLVRRKGHFQ